MPTILWNESSPDGGDSLGLGDNEIRSLKTSLRNGLDAEHVWPSGGGDAGVHRLGAARAHYGVQSNVSSTGTDGRLMQTSDTSRLFGVGSGGTTYLGGPTALSAGSFPGTVPQRALWVEEWGIGQTKSGTTTISFPNSGYSGAAFIQLTQFESTTNAQMFWVTGVGATSFVVRSSGTNDAGNSSATFFWRSVGSRTL